LDKKSFRKDCLRRLKKCPEDRKRILDKLILQKVAKFILHHKPKNILFYLPMKVEVNLNQLLIKERKKSNIFIPFIVEESFKMVHYRLPLRRNNYSIYESANSPLVRKKVDMIIVPVVGVDGNFKRVGFGKGMYDRFYEKLGQKPIVLFIQRVECKTCKKITDFHDIQADYYITPQKIQKLGKRDDNRDCIGRRWSHSRRRSSVYKF